MTTYLVVHDDVVEKVGVSKSQYHAVQCIGVRGDKLEFTAKGLTCANHQHLWNKLLMTKCSRNWRFTFLLMKSPNQAVQCICVRQDILGFTVTGLTCASNQHLWDKLLVTKLTVYFMDSWWVLHKRQTKIAVLIPLTPSWGRPALSPSSQLPWLRRWYGRRWSHRPSKNRNPTKTICQT